MTGAEPAIRRCLRLAILAAIVSLAACAGRGPSGIRGPAAPGAAGDGPQVGVYRARVSEGRHHRRFRLLLFAAPPDRLHAEVVHPLLGTELIVDGGADALSVAVVRDRLAFTGEAGSQALNRLVGVEIRTPDLVAALLGEPFAADPSYTVTRAPAGPPGRLPSRFAIRAGTRRLRLELRELRPAPARTSELGRGLPPDGFELRPLDELDWDWFPSRKPRRKQGKVANSSG